MPRVPTSEMPAKHVKGTVNILDEGCTLDEFGALDKGKYYLKVGRSTGLTAGVYNGNPGHVQMAWWKQNPV